ncbi:MAG: DUF4271 domain-containing protein [Rikenellaceae bacterium]
MASDLQHIADIPAYIFGPSSKLAEGIGEAVTPLSAAETAQAGVWFILAILALIAHYLMWLNHWSSKGRNHSRLFKLLFYYREDLPTKLTELSPSFKNYTSSGTVISFSVFWLAIATYFSLFAQLELIIAAMLLSAIFLTYGYQVMLVRLIGKIINDRGFAKPMLQIKGITYTVVGITILPTILCYTLTQGRAHEVFTYIVGAQLLAIALLYISKTFLFFISKKFSLLHTILYLCAVEIFPISLFWALFNR